MDFSVGRKSVPVVSAPSTTTRGAHATQILNLYNNPPKEEISMEEFERYALDRLRVLKGLDDARSRGKKPEEVNEICKKLIGDNLTGTSQQDTRRKDELSHFVLRLAYCRTEELRRWFLTQESILLRMRFNNAYSDHQLDFLADLGLEYKPISKDEFMRVFDKVRDVMRVTDPTGKTGILTEDDSSRFYKVPFEEVPELVASRRVYLSKGFAYVPRDQLSSLVVGHFRSKLSKALVLTSRKWSSYGLAEENDRLAPIVSALSNRYLGPDYSQPDAVGEAISLKELPALASRSFPLCMKNLYDKLREDHHLRHFGRMQLGLFLKGIGLTMEDALMFWKAEFTKKIPADKFEKEYAYNIRHNYGKEGKRQDYTPYTCMKVISSTPGAGDSHGCPYRHFSKENLHSALQGLRLNPSQIDDVMGKVAGNHYQVACSACFEYTHGQECESGVNHPNQYFDESRRVLKAQSSEVPKTPALQTPQSKSASAEGSAMPVTPVAMAAI